MFDVGSYVLNLFLILYFTLMYSLITILSLAHCMF